MSIGVATSWIHSTRRSRRRGPRSLATKRSPGARNRSHRRLDAAMRGAGLSQGLSRRLRSGKVQDRSREVDAAATSATAIPPAGRHDLALKRVRSGAIRQGRRRMARASPGAGSRPTPIPSDA